MSEAEKAILEKQKELLRQMDPVQKQVSMAYLEGMMAGKELAQGKS